jgi:serine/threonine-protein kinase
VDGERGKGPRQVRAGDTLGRYEIGDELGEGGMATVFRARDRELRRDVAVKVLFPHLARRSDVVRRFQREARAAASLEHANILRIYDVGGAEGDDPPYIVMELIRGRTLLQEIEARGAMLAEVAACIGAVLCDALAAAHAAGVIHRDVKPTNILIAPGGRLLLADFGVARLETEDSLVTRTGALLGTPAYMSPEQAIGDIATAKSDLYSLGSTIYQLATGALPYGGSPAKVLSLIAAGQLVPPARRRQACGADLSRLVVAAMATEPGDRPASAAAMAAELRGFVTAGGLGDAGEELAAYFEDPDGFLRARQPIVVSALVAAARAAIAGDKPPRAMALADRASALAPDDPAVAAVVRSVTEGGHAMRRKRRLVIGGLAVVLAGGATAGGLAIARSLSAPERRSGTLANIDPLATIAPASERDAAAPPDLGPGLAAAPQVSAPGDARPASLPGPGAGLDARGTLVRPGPAPQAPSAAGRRHDPRPPADAAPELASLTPPPIDARLAPEPDVPRDAGGHVIVHNDLWCNVWIDGVDRGSRRNELLDVAAGHHVVRCVNPAGEWTQEVDVAPGATRALNGTLLGELTIRLAIDATIDGKPHPRGAVVRIKPGSWEVVAGGKTKFLTFRGNCTLRDAPELDCYL